MRTVATCLALFFAIAAQALPQSSWQKVVVTSFGVNSSASLKSVTTSINLALVSISGDPIYKSIRSIDSGENWEAPFTVLAPLRLKSLNPDFLYGVRGDSIMTSANQGFSWPSPSRPALGMLPADVYYLPASPGKAWAVGDSPYVAMTTDNWSTFDSVRFQVVDSVSMTSVQFFDNNFGFAAGRSTKAGFNASVILRTTDGGLNWQDRSLPDVCGTTPFIAVDFVSPRIGWAAQTCGINVTIYKTTDSAASWSADTTLSLFQAFAIDALDSLHVWVVGRLGVGGAIASTSNGGTNWSTFQPPFSGRLLSVAMRDTTRGFACGEAATLLVYSPIGTDVPGGRANRPKSFELSQNYPNPFNGETRIAFTLQKSEPVTLTVYNILGQPIRTLLEGKLSAGKNEVSWDGRDSRGFAAPSGIYFYKLSTSEEKQVRKMVLLK